MVLPVYDVISFCVYHVLVMMENEYSQADKCVGFMSITNIINDATWCQKWVVRLGDSNEVTNVK